MLRYVTKTTKVLGTVIEITVPKKYAFLINYCFREAKRIDDTYSRFQEGNDLWKLNSNIGKWTEVSREFYKLISYGYAKHVETNGSIDMSVKEVLEASGYDKDYSFEAKPLTKWKPGKIELRVPNKVRVSKSIELGAFGKGYVIDQMVNILKDSNSYYINAGGDIAAKGETAERTLNKIFLEHPMDSNVMIGSYELDGESIAASSSNRRSWGDYNHLVDPNTGKSCKDMLGVFVVTNKAVDADCYATALFVMGYEKAKEFVLNKNLKALLISSNGRVYKSPNFKCELFV